MLMLLFYAGSEACACDTQDVVEVVPKVKFKKNPYMPPYVAGTLNYGGVPILVLDLCQLLTARESSSSMHTRIIIFRNPNAQKDSFSLLGLIAEKITETKKIEVSKCVQSELALPHFPYLKGLLMEGTETFQVISLPILFDHFAALLKNPSKVSAYE